MFTRIANTVLSTFEDPTGTDRPLWVDISRHQGAVDFGILSKAGVYGVCARAGISWGYQDAWFPTYWQGAGDFSLYRTSYHVIYTDQPILKQADNWYRVHPEINGIPRVIDLEIDREDPASAKAAAVWIMTAGNWETRRRWQP